MDQDINNQGNIPNLTYGCVISIEQSLHPGNFVYSQGHIKPTVMIKNFFKTHKQMSGKAVANTKEVDFNMCLFQIYPKVSNTNKNQILNKLKQLEEEALNEKANAKGKANDNRGIKTTKKLSVEMVNDYQTKLLNEYKYNVDTFEKSKNMTVYYFEDIQLLHLNSSKFLACHDCESKMEQENFQITLDEYTSESTSFKIIPAYKYQKDGDTVIYDGEIVNIVRSQAFHNKQTFLHASMELTSKDNTGKQMSSLANTMGKITNKEIQTTSNTKKKKQKKEVNASLEEPTAWACRLFSEYIPPENKYLKSGDVIWLHHSEANTTLVANRLDKGTNKYNFSSLDLNYWLSLENLEIQVQQTRQESSYDEYSGNTFGMWIIEDQDIRSGGLIAFEKKYRLKHLSTGYYLCVQKSKLEKQRDRERNSIKSKAGDKDDDQFILYLSERAEENTLFQFYPLKTSSSINDKYVQIGSFVFIRNVMTKKWIDVVSSVQDISYSASSGIPKQPALKTDHSENQVFKFYKATSQEIWEINFLIACFDLLVRFIYYINNHQISSNNKDQNADMQQIRTKMQRVQLCIEELDNFCNCKVGNSSPDQKVGQINVQRQKLLREQYFIDILVKLLEEVLKKHELEIFQRRDQIYKSIEDNQKDGEPEEHEKEGLRTSKLNRKTMAPRQKLKQVDESDKKEFLHFIEQKVQLYRKIYSLMSSITSNNRENELYAFELIPFFQITAKYLPEAIHCIINICSNNKKILNKLHENLKIEYDHINQLQGNNQKQDKTVKFLINLYDEDSSNKNEDHIVFRQHDKITSKAINLIQYHMNLIWDESATLKSDYMKFLRNVCKIGNKGVTLNQENIYKLYKKYTSIRNEIRFDKYFKSGSLRLPAEDSTLEEIQDWQIQVSEQLMFFSALAYGRNFLWRKELIPHFSNHYLLENIWNESILSGYADLRSCFIKLAMSLYIDHDPLYVIQLPQFCRLFKNIDISNRDEVRVFKIENNQENEIVMYNGLLIHMMKYFKSINDNIKREIEDTAEGLASGDIKIDLGYRAKDILNQSILLNSIDIMQLMLNCNMFAALENDQGWKPSDYYAFIIYYLFRIFIYDRANMKYVISTYKSENKLVKSRMDKKKEMQQLNIPGMGGLKAFNMLNPLQLMKKKEEPEIEEEDADKQYQDDLNVYKNPVMRGQIRLQNQLDLTIYEDQQFLQNEIQIKLKILQLAEYFLDMRQDYLMTNFLAWFKHNVIEESDENQKEWSVLIKENVKFLLPNISKTGINDVDEIYKPKPEKKEKEGNLMDMQNMLKLGGDKKKIGFYNFVTVEGFTPQMDLDQLYSLAYENMESEANANAKNVDMFSLWQIKNNKEGEEPVSSILSVLMPCFLLINEPNLEKKCLKLIMRLFNQRQEFIDNLSNFQVIFDDEKTKLFLFLKDKILNLQKLIEQSEVWFSSYIHDTDEGEDNAIHRVLKIIKIITKGFFQRLDYKDGDIVINGEQIIDPKKQMLNKFLKTYEPILDLLKDDMHHFEECILNEHFPDFKKAIVIELFSSIYQLLKYFVQGNKENQMILFEYMDIFTAHLKYDIGQIELISEIYRNNQTLLTKHVDQKFIDTFTDLIEHEGRQGHILDLFITILKLNGKYIFDNQLLLLNSFIPMKQLTETNIKLLFIDGSVNITDMKFYLEDIVTLDNMTLMHKLKLVEFRDTYCDLPFTYHSKLLQMLLETSYMKEMDRNLILDGFSQQFNISIAKLKKAFKLSYLLEIMTDNSDSFLDLTKLKKDQKKKKQKNKVVDEKKQNKEQEAVKKQLMHGFSYLKPKVLEFISCVHIESEKVSATSEFIICQKEFIDFIKGETSRIEHQVQEETIESTYINFLFEGLLPFFNLYYSQFIANGITSHLLEDEERKDDKELLNFAKALHNKILLFKDNTTKRQMLRAQKLFIKLIHDLPEDYNIFVELGLQKKEQEEIKLQEEEDTLTKPSKFVEQWQPVKNQLNDEVIIGDNFKGTDSQLLIKKTDKEQTIQQKPIKKNKVGIFGSRKVAKEPVRQIDKNNYRQIELLWNEYVDEFRKSPLVNEELGLEKQALADSIINIKKLIDKDYEKIIFPKPNVGLVLKKFIIWLQTAIKDPDNKNSIIILLDVLKKIIEQSEDDKAVTLQNQLDNLGAMRMVLIILSDNSSNLDSDVLISLLTFANLMLEGGNNQVQKTIFDFVSNYPKSEVLFYKFNQIIKSQIDYIEERAKQNDRGPQGQDEDEKRNSDIEILNQVLSFLQLSVEGHYLELQNYYRQQTNSRNNYDMINAVADLLRAYYYDARTQKMYDNMIKCLETLSEFVQGPCMDNQAAVSESKFFDIASDIFGKKQKSEEKDHEKKDQMGSPAGRATLKLKAAVEVIKLSLNKDEKPKGEQDLEPWMVSRLQNKCLILILSLLEMRDVKQDPSIIKRIMPNLPLNVLSRHLVKVYKRFDDLYKGKFQLASLNHLEEDPRKLSQQELQAYPPNYFEFILQNGFYLFFLISYYIESDDNLDDPVVSLNKQQQKKILKVQKEGLEAILFGDSIIGQLLQFVLSIVKESIETANKLKSMALDKMTAGGEQDEEQKQKILRQKAEKKRKMLRKAFNFFADNTAHIDVVRNEKLEIVYFMLLPYCKLLPKEKKQQFHDSVDRSNTKSKVSDLVESGDDLIEICKNEFWLKSSNNKLLTFFGQYVKLFKDLAFFFTLIINLFIFLSFGTKYGDRMNNYQLFMMDDYSKDQTQRLITIMGLIMTVCSNFVLAFFLLKNVPLIISKSWKKNLGNPKDEENTFQKVFSIGFNIFKILISFFQEVEMLYYIAYGALAILGVIMHPFFFTFHLTEIMMRYPSLKNILKSVYEPRSQLILTFMLYMIIQFIFSIIGYVFFSKYYHGNCDSVLWCFLFTFDQSFKSNGGVGMYFTGSNNETNVARDEGYGRFFFYNMFTYILVLIMVQIVGGIIIDTFGSLREIENAKNQDIWDKCFICGNFRTTFDRKSDSGSGFLQHIKCNHYMWNYIFFIAYLMWKDTNDYTGIESFVSSQLSERETSWFPNNMARELVDIEEDDQKYDLNVLTKIKEDTQRIYQLLEETNMEIKKISEKI